MNATLCSLFHDLSSNIGYHLIVFTKGVLCLAGALRVSSHWKQYGVRFLVHENTKVLFRFYYAISIFHSFLLGSFYLSELVRLRFECFLIDFRYLLLTRCIGIASIIAAHQVITLMSFERLYSSIFPAHFEKNSSRGLAVVLALTVIVCAYIYSMMLLSNNFRLFRELKIALPNELVPQNREGFEALMSAFFLSNILSLFMFSIDLYLNFLRRRVSNSSLSISYQFSENRRIILTLLPIEATETLLGLFSALAQIVYGKFLLQLFQSSTLIGHQIFLELTTLITHFPLILSFFIKHSVEKNANKTHVLDPAVDHFAELRKSWEMQAGK